MAVRGAAPTARKSRVSLGEKAQEGPGQWVKKTAFAMPLVPESLGIDPYITAVLHSAAFLEISDDDAVDPDAAIEAMESVSAYLQRLPSDRQQALRAALARLSAYGRLFDFLDGFFETSGPGGED